MQLTEKTPTNLKYQIYKKMLSQTDLVNKMLEVEFEDKSGVNRSDLSRIVNGKLIPSETQKEIISKALGIPVKTLFKDCPESWNQLRIKRVK